jgi:hypothetical protein
MTLGDGERIVAVERMAESEVDDLGGSIVPPPASELN